MLIEKKKTVELLPAEYNPRKDLKPGDEEYEKLKRSIEEFGYVEPVIWNKTTGRVVGGHQRLKVLIDLGITEVDCVVIEMDDAKEKALNIALNKISGDWDKDKLTLLIADLQGEDFDVSLTGFDPAEIDDLFKDSLKYGMHDDDFDVDAIILKAPKSHKVKLVKKSDGTGMEFDYTGFENLTLWTPPKKQAPFFCLEPWNGLPAYTDESGNFEEKPGCISLEAGKEYSVSYSITVLK